MNNKNKNFLLYPDTTINYHNITWKERQLDQLYINTYRHFTNKIRQIKSFKPPLQTFQPNWFDAQYFHTEPKNQSSIRAMVLQNRKKKNLQKSCDLSPHQQVQWLSTKRIQSQSKKQRILPSKTKPATVSVSYKSPIKIRKTYMVKKPVSPFKTTNYIFDSQTIVDIILAVNKVKIMPYPSSSFIYFNVYVEDGNNSQMIKNAVRRRSGWRVVEAPNVANLIWSQFYRYNLDSRPQRKLKDIVRNKDIENDIDIQVKAQPFKTNPNLNKKREESHPLSPSQYSREMKKLCPFNEHLHEKQCLSIQSGPGLHLYNHFPNHYCISDKKNLLKFLTHYYQSKGKNVFTDVPYSVEIDEETDMYEVRKRLSQIGGVWILKPGENSNRGKGITVCRDIDMVFKEIQVKVSKSQNSLQLGEKKLKKSLLIQQYVEPLLYNKRKIDLRMFMLVTFVKGKVRGYLYDEGYVRTSSKIFSLDSFDRFIHLTNDAVQFESSDYGKYEEGNKLSWKKFQQWCQEKLHEQFWFDFNAEIKTITRNILIASKDQLIKKGLKRRKMKHERTLSFSQYQDTNKTIEEENIYFQLFGLDFLIDKDYKVWLIEANTNPALNTQSSRVLRNLIPKLIDNAFDLSIEPFSRINKTVDIVKYENHFENIYDDEHLPFYQ